MDLVISHVASVPRPSLELGPRPFKVQPTRPAPQVQPQLHRHNKPQYARPTGPKPYWQPAHRSQRAPHHRTAATKSAVASAAAGLSKGDLVEFTNKERQELGLVGDPDGKTKVWVGLKSGRRASIQPKQVVLRLPGGPFTDSDLSSFVAEAAAAEASVSNLETAESSPLRDAWEMAAADGVALGLADMAALVLEDDSAKNLYRMYRMLAADRLYFKQVVAPKAPNAAVFDALPCYQPRAEDEVEAARRVLAEEAAAAAARAAWQTAVKAALGAKKRSQQPTQEAWAAGEFADRIAALKDLAILDAGACSEARLALAKESLALAGIHPPGAAPAGMAPPDQPSLLAEAAAGLLVDIRALRQHEPLAALRKRVAMEHEADVERAAAELLAAPPADSCAAARVDLTHLRTYTIDDFGTTEVDDGLSVEVLEPGTPGGPSRTRLWVHVADPTRWLSPRGPLIEAAARRGRTAYFPWGSAAMFPRQLAEGPFSLRAGHVCDALSVSAELLPGGEVGQVAVVPTRVRISHKFTYDQADKLIRGALDGSSTSEVAAPPAEAPSSEGEEQPAAVTEAVTAATVGPEVVADLAVLRRAADQRRVYRESKGCIEIPLPETKVYVPSDDLDSSRPRVVLKRLSQWESASRGLVAEMMILAGEAAGRVGAAAGLPLPYRGQPQPALPPMHDLEGLPGPCKGYALRRCMTRSTIAPGPHRHASLGLDTYVQVTSPIRRHTDLVAHFNLKSLITGSAPPFSAADIEALAAAAGSEASRAMNAAERAEDNYWVAEFFRQQRTAGPNPQYPATVLGWQRQDLKLAAVLLDEIGLEVVVKVDIDVAPGDYVMLGLLETKPVAGLLRFYVTDYTSKKEADEEAEESPVSSVDSIWEEVEAGAAGASAESGASLDGGAHSSSSNSSSAGASGRSSLDSGVSASSLSSGGSMQQQGVFAAVGVAAAGALGAVDHMLHGSHSSQGSEHGEVHNHQQQQQGEAEEAQQQEEHAQAARHAEGGEEARSGAEGTQEPEPELASADSAADEPAESAVADDAGASAESDS